MKPFKLIAVAILLSSIPVCASGRKFVTLVPMNGTPVTLIVNGKEKDYYSLRPHTSIKLQVDGPGRLITLSRLRFAPTVTSVEKYSIRVTEGKNTLKIHSTQTDLSEASIKSSDDVPGKSRKFSVNVPEGSFTYEIWLDDTPREAVVRFMLEPSKVKKNLVDIQPLLYDKIVTAKINENLVAYYVASREKPVQFRVVGPTEVQVSARLNYDESMQGEQKYSLVISEGEDPVARKLLQTTKSAGLSYEDWAEVVPGKPNKLSFAVPEGEHTYRLSLGESVAQSVSLKFSIPKKDLNNEE